MKTSVASRAPSLSRCLLVGALVLAGQPTCASTHVPLQRRADAPAFTTASKRMADGREWTTTNSDVDVAGSFCYGDAASNCRRYGRLYTWESARRACQALGAGWRLPTADEWHRLAQRYGGSPGDDGRLGAAAYEALLAGGRSGFDAVLGGGRSGEGEYARGDAHGFYWTATESSADAAVFFNFGKGSRGLYRQREGEKARAFSVRCVKD